ncbi:MAG: hypothetical protein HY432_01765 [Candidatus Liptonbacteria bacterium]|nr:hypothetical protein [Candidatus Liptonbacteria bacterium]
MGTVFIPAFWNWFSKWGEKVGMVIVVAAFVLGGMTGCAGLSDPAKPRTAAEEFPLRNQDPRVGLVINTGTAPMNLFIYDKANRLVEQVYINGADRHLLSANGQPYPQYWIRTMPEVGQCYRVEIYPFYKAWHLLYGQYRVDLPSQTASICLGNNPTSYWYSGRHWGWLLQTGVNIPDAVLPLIQIQLPF